MSKLVWDKEGEHLFETGVSNVALYPVDVATGNYSKGVAWNGVTAITESPSGADATKIYADNIKYLNLRAAEDFGATIEAYTYPDEWAKCDGSAVPVKGAKIGQQPRSPFGLAYKTKIGNDTVGDSLGYKIHIIYGATAAPSERAFATVNDSPEAITFSWEMETTPVPVEGYNPTAVFELDSTDFTTEAEKAALQEIEDTLFGSDSAEAAIMMPNDIISKLKTVING